MNTTSIIQLAALIILILLSGFFSSAETALTTVNKIRIQTLAEEGNRRAITLLKVLGDSVKMLSAILIGNNIVNISASSLATILTLELFGNASVGIATGLLTLILLVFGEITPKTIATLYSEQISLAYAPIALFLMRILTPVIVIINALSGGVLTLFHVDPSGVASTMTENELKTIVDVSHKDGVIESDERKMIYNVFDFGDSMARDIMVPRIHMCSIEVNASYEEVLNLFHEDKYTRLPVYENDTDNIIGMINLKDFFLSNDSKRFFKIKDIMRDVYYTYEHKKTSDLLMEMRKSSKSLTIVLNEYGAATGMITLEDLLEEIVGEIRDEYDEDEKDLIKEISDHEYLVEGSVKLDDLNEALSLSLESEDYDSIGGLVIGILNRLPEAGEAVTTPDNITLEVLSTSKNKIDKVHLILPEDDTAQVDEAFADNIENHKPYEETDFSTDDTISLKGNSEAKENSQEVRA